MSAAQRRIHQRVPVGADAAQSQGVREKPDDLVAERLRLKNTPSPTLGASAGTEQRDVEARVGQRVPHERHVVPGKGRAVAVFAAMRLINT